jgi:uncharacterized protein
MNKILDIDTLPKKIPIFPLSDCLLLPNGTISLNIFEPRYLNMTEDAISSNRLIGMIQPKKNYKDELDLYSVGCVGKITHFSELKNQKLLIELTGICRYELLHHTLSSKDYRIANINFDKYSIDLNKPNTDLIDSLRKEFIINLKNYFNSQEIEADWKIIEKAPSGTLVNSLAQSCPFNTEEKQMLLESKDFMELVNIMITLFKIYSAGEVKNLN